MRRVRDAGKVAELVTLLQLKRAAQRGECAQAAVALRITQTQEQEARDATRRLYSNDTNRFATRELSAIHALHLRYHREQVHLSAREAHQKERLEAARRGLFQVELQLKALEKRRG